MVVVDVKAEVPAAYRYRLATDGACTVLNGEQR
jgi:hypothetical protein